MTGAGGVRLTNVPTAATETPHYAALNRGFTFTPPYLRQCDSEVNVWLLFVCCCGSEFVEPIFVCISRESVLVDCWGPMVGDTLWFETVCDIAILVLDCV